MSEPVNILCLKWGNRYPSDYANKLYRSVERNLERTFRFFCCTDNPEKAIVGYLGKKIPYQTCPAPWVGEYW
ncbi:MAG: hypothetical protein JJT75_12665 [Opitutales bacterium]|nr:hypothetical protein [Opitutales bacterium]MCH8539599.1 hypothetical protein [Opitutales bacterium]